jgi:hypothetical protein
MPYCRIGIVSALSRILLVLEDVKLAWGREGVVFSNDIYDELVADELEGKSA